MILKNLRNFAKTYSLTKQLSLLTNSSFKINEFPTKLNRKFHSLDDIDSKVSSSTDDIFDLICQENNTIQPSHLTDALSSCGLWRNDVRLKRFFKRLEKHERGLEGDKIDRESFKHLISGREGLFKQVIFDDLAVPNFLKFCKELNSIYRNCRTNWKGEITNWPDSANSFQGKLGTSGSDYWAVSVCSIDGQRHNMGDVDVLFPVHSCSWPLSYAMAVNQMGSQELRRFIGRDLQNTSAYHHRYHHHKLPSSLHHYLTDNPLSLPGSIVIASLLYRGLDTSEKRIDRLLQDYRNFISPSYMASDGDDDDDNMDDSSNITMKVNKELYRLATDESHFFKAVGHLLKYSNCFPGVCLDEALELHLRTCCVEMNSKTLALIAATLANGGRCPTSTASSVKHSPQMTRDTLTYLHSHSSLSRSVGLPLMTSSTGGVFVVVDGLFGMCLWSPPLDGGGVSCRSLQFINEMIDRFNLHESSSQLSLGNKVNPRKRRSFQKAGHVGDLLFSAFRGDLYSVEDMHNRGLNMQARDYDGRSALHVASSEGKEEIVHYLVDTCGVSMEMADRWGRTPVGEAERMGRTDIRAFLQRRMLNKKTKNK